MQRTLRAGFSFVNTPADKQTIFRVHRDERERWTPLLNETICDPRMSFRATGLLVYLLSKPLDWTVRQSQLAGAKKEGRDAVVTAFNELRELGYIEKEIVREKGKITSTVWHVYERPRTAADSRLTEKPETAGPETAGPETAQPKSVNPELQRTEGNKGLKETKETHADKSAESVGVYIDADGNAASAELVMLEWNKLPTPFAKVRTLTDARKRKIATRLKNDEWLDAWREAIKLMPNIPFLRGEKKGSTWVADFDWFIRNDENVMKVIEGKYGTGAPRQTGPNFSKF